MKKKFLYLTLALFANITLKAQNSMQFSKVLLVESIDTVPQGKVWKIQSVLSNCSSPDCSSIILVNGKATTTFTYQTGMPSTGSRQPGTGNPTNLPIWLPSGTTLNISSSVQFISVIEFNIE